MRHTKKDTAAISLTEVTLLAIIVALIALIGGFVVHSKHQVDKELAVAGVNSTTVQRLESCVLADKTTRGMTFGAPFGTYSICIPNGWRVYRAPSSTVASAVISYDTTYNAKTKPIIGTLTSGKDGSAPFAIYSNQTAQTIDKMLTKVGTIKSTTLAGTEYYFKQTAQPVDAGLNGFAIGTVIHEYYFEKDGRSLAIVHVVRPNTTDQARVVQQMVASLQIN